MEIDLESYLIPMDIAIENEFLWWNYFKNHEQYRNFIRKHFSEISRRTDEIQEMDPDKAAEVILDAVIKVPYSVIRNIQFLMNQYSMSRFNADYDKFFKNPTLTCDDIIHKTIKGYNCLIHTYISKNTGKGHLLKLVIKRENYAGDEVYEVVGPQAAAEFEAMMKYVREIR